MSRPRRISAYPGWLIALLSEFEAAPRERVLSFPTIEAARRFRFDLYGFVGAVRAEGAGADWPNVTAMRTRMTLCGDGTAVMRLYHADDEPAPSVTS